MKKVLLLISIVCMICLVSAAPTTYNPFTGKLDFYGLNNDIRGFVTDFLFSNGGELDINMSAMNASITQQGISAGFNSTYNVTYDAKVTDNESWNETLASTLYSDIIWGYNQTYTLGTYNVTYDTYAYNQSDGSYNVTYDEWAYNQTVPANAYTDATNNSLATYLDDLKLNKTDQRYNDTALIISTNNSLASWIDLTYAALAGGNTITGQQDYNGGWLSDGCSIIDGSIFCQTGYFYNIIGLGVNTLEINGSLLPTQGWDDTFDIGNSSLRWRNIYVSGQIIINGTNFSGGHIPQNAVMSFNQVSCPIGWTLADGTSGTPDLRGIFVRGAGTSGSMLMANGTNFSATYATYGNDSFQGHKHPFYTDYVGDVSLDTPYSLYSNSAGSASDFLGHADSVRGPIEDSDGTPRTGAETAPASYALIYCVKTETDSSVSDSLWQRIAGVISPTNSTNFVKIITSDTQKDKNYTINTNDRSGLIVLNSSTGADKIFTLPSGNDGDVYRILNDAEYVLTINVSDTSSIWNSGPGYGIDLPDKGTMVELRYSSSRNKWDILQKTGGKVLIEGLKFMEPMNEITARSSDFDIANIARAIDKTKKHVGEVQQDLVVGLTATAKFPPSHWTFDGAGDYVLYADSDDWDIFGTQTGHKTVAFWVYANDATNAEMPISFVEDDTNRWYLEIGTDTMTIQYRNSGGVYMSESGGTISDTTWHHVALILNGPETGVYIDGIQVIYDATFTADPDLDGSLYIGTYKATAEFLTGRMQDLHISYNNPYGAVPNAGSTDSFTLPAAPFRGVMN